MPAFPLPSGSIPPASLDAARKLLSEIPFRPIIPVLEKWLERDLRRVYDTLGNGVDPVFSTVLQRLNLQCNCTAEDLCRIPAKGPVIVVANHPFGLADGALVGALISAVRTDFRLLVSSMLETVPQLQRHIISVDNIGDPSAVHTNLGPLRRSLEWLRAGGLLVTFPAGEVASVHGPAWGIRDTAWTSSVVRLAQRTNSVVIPVYFHGSNSPVFHLAGMVNPQFRTLLLLHELLNKTGARVRISIGSPIAPTRLSQSHGCQEATAYMRARTDVLQYRQATPVDGKLPTNKQALPLVAAPAARIAIAADPVEMNGEIAGLPSEQCLVEQSEYQVWIASAPQIPAVLHEIGRLREITFRKAGEGTGAPLDLDRLDQHYQHLFIWNQSRQEVIGAYRLAAVGDVIRSQGTRGLYTGKLFHLHHSFYNAIQPALELGRSFVRSDYQKSYQALLLLWKGLGQYIAQNPHFRVLFGAVSISKNYCESSRALMVSYLTDRHTNSTLGALVQPRRKFKVRHLGACDPRSFTPLLSNLAELSEVIADIEPDRKGLPILLQHYLNLGGQVLDFSVDKNFASVLDGLIVVDLTKTDRRHLERYMGKANAQSYLNRHARVSA